MSKSLSTAELRSRFLSFFETHDHRVMESSSLVPASDPTLLFTNAGMVQFKDVFLGAAPRPAPRAVSSQRCLRAGGKHNDLDQVGYTARHHTFFEMLGNFSFGDYFKERAIELAWSFLIEELGLPPEKLWVTVFEEDDEAARIWREQMGVDGTRFSRIGAKDNFWAMGDTGPCGPCTEIFYDHGPEIAGGPPGSADEDGDRFVEIWNLVFMQYDRGPDGTLRPLPRPCVDTGAGLERVAAVVQGVHSNYDIDLFRGLVEAAAEYTGAEAREPSLRVIADHIRASAFLIADGVVPDNDGRGYVLRRIIRRALRHGHKLGASMDFFAKMTSPLVVQMGAAYPLLVDEQDAIESALAAEGQRFGETIAQGMEVFEREIAGIDSKILPGELVFRLYDTYGFPPDLTADIARERGLCWDEEGFTEHMAQQKARARAAAKFTGRQQIPADALRGLVPTEFVGYEQLTNVGAEVFAIVQQGSMVAELSEGSASLILSRTPFYAESGGQIGDEGIICGDEMRFRVSDTQKLGEFHVHEGVLESGRVRTGDAVQASVEGERRDAIARNHSATHLLHAALRAVLGEHVLQKGSLVAADRLRFDFSHPQPVSDTELEQIERMVNREILRNEAADVRVMAREDALAEGALALFGEKYADEVRVLRLGEFSMELCGGTHVTRLGDIGLFRILGESAVASGVRRIEAVTGDAALDIVIDERARLRRLGALVKSRPDEVESRVEALLERNRELEKELERARQQAVSGSGSDLSGKAKQIGDARFIASELALDAKGLRAAVDQLKAQLGDRAVIVLGGLSDGKLNVVAGVGAEIEAQISAADLVREVAGVVGGRGGGKPSFAQAGGGDSSKLAAGLERAEELLRSSLAPA